jgi:ADP-ribose pyrophosphatase
VKQSPPDQAAVPDPTEGEPTDIDPGPAIDDLTETVVASRVIHKGHYLTVRVDTIERADGTRAERDVVGHPGAVAILAIDPDNNVLLVRQFRSPAGRVLLEIPAGTLDRDPETGAIEDHALAAKRELEEETGYRAGTWRHLTSFWTAPGFATELMHLWLATDLRPADGETLGPDEDEHLRLDRLPFLEAVAAAERGEIADAKSLVALLWLDRLVIGASSDAASLPVSPSADAISPGSIRISYKLGLAQFLGAIAVLSRHSRGAVLFGAVLTVMSLFALYIGVDISGWLLTLIFGILIVTGLFPVPFAWFAVRRRRELIEEPVDVVVDASGVARRSPSSQSHVSWDAFVRVREIGGWFFLDTGAGANYPVPKLAFSPEDLAAFRKLIADAGFGMDGRRKSQKRPKA